MDNPVYSFLSVLVGREGDDHSWQRRLDRVHLDRIYMDQTGLLYNWIFFGFGIAFLLSTMYLLYFVLHRHPLLIVRCPKVFAFDVGLNCVNCIIQSMMNMNYFQLYLGCQPWTAFVDGTDVASNMISIGRAVLYYNQAASIAKMSRYPTMDKLMDIIAWFTCPEDYFRNKDWKHLVREAVEIQGLYKPHDIYDQSTRLGQFQQWSTRGGFMRCVYAITGWFLVGVTYSLVATSYGLRQLVGDASAASPLSCWVAYLTPISPVLYFFSCALHLLILVAIWDMRDSVGIRNDMVLSLTIGVFFKFLNGFFMVYPVWQISWQYTYSPAAIMSSLDSMFYLMYFVLIGSHSPNSATFAERLKSAVDEDEEPVEYELRRAMMYLKGPNQFRQMNTKMERLWNTTKGKQRILELASKYYIFESLRFLGESDALMDSIMIDRQEYVRIYKTFIRVDSQWQLNLSSTMREQYLSLLHKHELLAATDLTASQDEDLEKQSPPHNVAKDIPGAILANQSQQSSPSVIAKGANGAHITASNSTKTERTILFSRTEVNEQEDHIEEFTDLLYRIRHEIFQMIDPMIRRDLHLVFQKEVADKESKSLFNSMRSSIHSSVKRISSHSQSGSRISNTSARESGGKFLSPSPRHLPTISRASLLQSPVAMIQTTLEPCECFGSMATPSTRRSMTYKSAHIVPIVPAAHTEASNTNSGAAVAISSITPTLEGLEEKHGGDDQPPELWIPSAPLESTSPGALHRAVEVKVKRKPQPQSAPLMAEPDSAAESSSRVTRLVGARLATVGSEDSYDVRCANEINTTISTLLAAEPSNISLLKQSSSLVEDVSEIGSLSPSRPVP